MKIVEFKHFTSFSAGSQVNLIKLRDNFFLNKIKLLQSLHLFTRILITFFQIRLENKHT